MPEFTARMVKFIHEVYPRESTHALARLSSQNPDAVAQFAATESCAA